MALAIQAGGCLIALISAGISARDMVHESKFCEECEQFMQSQTKAGLGLGAAKAVTRALARRQFGPAADLLGSYEGTCAVPTVFWCPVCDKGYLEVQAKFKCTWVKKDKETESKEEAWLVASEELEPEHVALFRERPRHGGESDD